MTTLTNATKPKEYIFVDETKNFPKQQRAPGLSENEAKALRDIQNLSSKLIYFRKV